MRKRLGADANKAVKCFGADGKTHDKRDAEMQMASEKAKFKSWKGNTTNPSSKSVGVSNVVAKWVLLGLAIMAVGQVVAQL